VIKLVVNIPLELSKFSRLIKGGYNYQYCLYMIEHD
jgi:hypothetical protein